MPFMETVRLTASDGTALEGRWDRAENAAVTVVFCHPDPLQGGSMDAPLMVGVSDRLVARGFDVLRFNFRGVGGSGGRSTRGDLEVLDVDAAYEHAGRRPGRLALAGWSFGGAMALRWLAWSGIALPYAGIAPATTLAPLPETLPAAPRLFIVGDQEQVIDVARLEDYSTRSGAQLVTVPGSDHFFHLRAEKVGDLVADFLGGLNPPA